MLVQVPAKGDPSGTPRGTRVGRLPEGSHPGEAVTRARVSSTAEDRSGVTSAGGVAS